MAAPGCGRLAGIGVAPPGGGIGTLPLGRVCKAGPGATRAGGMLPGEAAGRFSERATAGVTPCVASVGCTGGRAIGWAAASAVRAWGESCCACGPMGRDCVIADAGTTVAAPALTKRLLVILVLLIALLVTLVMVLMFVTLVTFTLRTNVGEARNDGT